MYDRPLAHVTPLPQPLEINEINYDDDTETGEYSTGYYSNLPAYSDSLAGMSQNSTYELTPQIKDPNKSIPNALKLVMIRGEFGKSFNSFFFL